MKEIEKTEREKKKKHAHWLLRWSWHCLLCSKPLVGLFKLYPLRGKICSGWTRGPPLLPDFCLLSFTFFSSTPSVFQTLFKVFWSFASWLPLARSIQLILLWSCSPLWSHHIHIVLICPSIASHFSISTLWFYVSKAAFPQSLPSPLILPTVMLFSTVRGWYI